MRQLPRSVAATLGILVAASALTGCGHRNAGGPEEEPSHEVSYLVSTIGTANGDLTIGYTDAAGGGGTDTSPGFAMVWSKQLTTDPGLPEVSLQASGSSSDLSFKMYCEITVDGVKKTNTGPYACSLTVSFAAIRPSLAAAASATPTTAPAAAPTTQSAASIPVGCTWVSMADAESIIMQQSGVLKPVLSWGGTDTACHYVFDQNESKVSWVYEPGGTAQAFPGTEVDGLGYPAYWLELGTFNTLEVQLPGGLFSVTTSFFLLQLDQKATALAFAQAALPHLS